jgi:hypothetical protein
MRAVVSINEGCVLAGGAMGEGHPRVSWRVLQGTEPGLGVRLLSETESLHLTIRERSRILRENATSRNSSS